MAPPAAATKLTHQQNNGADVENEAEEGRQVEHPGNDRLNWVLDGL